MYDKPHIFLTIEHSQSEYVLFQAASTIREAVMREWMVLSVEDKEGLRGYVMHYLMCRLR